MTFLQSRGFVTGLVALAVLIGSLSTAVYRAVACPFCSAVSLTFGEEISNAQVAVIAKLSEAPPPASDANSLDVAKAKFEVVKVLKGQEILGKERKLEAVYFGDSPLGTTFLILGIDPPNINWSTPIAISERGIDYITRGMDLPKEGADRLVFFQDFLEDKDETLARDAYDEFAKAPYADVNALAPRMHHERLIAWVQSPDIPVSRRRLYLTMLGAARDESDIPVFEAMIQSKDRQTKGALDALVAAYLTLEGPDGMPLVEDLFLRNQDAEYTDTYATIMALRFHGTEEKVIPRERLLEGLRLMLDRPKLADLVIPDLARWEDWSVIDQLVELFKNSDEESSWVRVPVINYLRACPLPVAKERMDELAKLDPESIKRANSFFPLGTAAGAKDGEEADGEEKPADEPTEEAAEKPAAEKPATDEKAAELKPAAAKASTLVTERNASDPPAAMQPVVPTIRMPAREVSQARPARPTAVLPGHLARDAAAVPGPPARTLPVVSGMLGAAFVLTCAFWGLLKGGRRATV